jgi:hypothetical protein
VRDGVKAVIEKIKDWLPRIKKVVDFLGGFSGIAKIAAGVLAGPLVKSVLGMIGPIMKLGAALLSTPVGWIILAGLAIVGLANKLGILAPFVEGFKEGFAGVSEAIGPALQNLLKTVAKLIGDIFGIEVGEDSALDPKFWKEAGEAVGKFAGETLVDLINGLSAALGFVDKLGKGIGSLIGMMDVGVQGDAEGLHHNEKMTQLEANLSNAKRSGNEAWIKQAQQNLANEQATWNKKNKNQNDSDNNELIYLPETAPANNNINKPSPASAPAAVEQAPTERRTRTGIFDGFEEDEPAPTSGSPARGDPVMAPQSAPIVQETKHTEENITVNKVEVVLKAEQGTEVVSAPGTVSNNVHVGSGSSMTGRQNG